MDTIRKFEFINETEKIFLNKTFYRENYPEHCHEFLEIVYISHGSGIHCINGNEYNVVKGDLFLINLNAVHTFKNTSSDFIIINCIFLPEMIDESLINSENAADLFKTILFQRYFTGNNDLLISINLFGHIEEFDRIFEDMILEYENKGAGYLVILKSYITIVLSKIFQLSAKEESGRGDWVEKVIGYLKQNYNKPLRLEEVARQALFSPSHFATAFKSTTGVSLLEYIHQIRVEEACRLLDKQNTSVKASMLEVGYSDTHFFYDIFKRYTGMTPGQYKKRRYGKESIKR